MNITPINQTSFGRFGYYGKAGAILEEVYPNYSSSLKDTDVVFVRDSKGTKYPVSAGNIRTLAIQEKYPSYRYMFKDSDVVERKNIGGSLVEITAGDIRKEFAQEEINSKKGTIPYISKIDYEI